MAMISGRHWHRFQSKAKKQQDPGKGSIRHAGMVCDPAMLGADDP